jgi:type IV pilus assembly protein PilC
MNTEEFAFANQQLAGMLRSGIPLEGALRQLCATLRQGTLRTELEALAGDLERGLPLRRAVEGRRLPPLYAGLLQASEPGDSLPMVLGLAADYYHHTHALWMRLKGLLVYPAILLVMSIGLSTAVGCLYSGFIRSVGAETFLNGMGGPMITSGHVTVLWIQVWTPVVLLAALGIGAVVALQVPRARDWLEWHMPGFREARLSRLGRMLHLLVSRGASIGDAVELLRRMEPGRALGREMARWQERLSRGATRFPQLTEGSPVIPPLFGWMVEGTGENWPAGFLRAAELYQTRAGHRTDLLLFAALPTSVLLLGAIILSQFMPLVATLVRLMESIGGP